MYKPHEKICLLEFRHNPIDMTHRNTGSNALKCIIVGPCGNGKTTIINNLCGSNLDSGIASESLTRDVTEMKCQFDYDIPMVYYDTPGTDAKTAKLEHAILLKHLLEYRPLNAVFVLVNIKTRIDDLVNTFYKHNKMMEDCPNIVYVVTHMDTLSAEEREEAIKLMNKYMNKHNLNNQVIFMSNKLIDERKLSDAFYYIARSMVPVKIKID